MVSLLTPHLTNPHGELIAHSVPGMAHFAGTGPDGATCRQCALWGSKKTRREPGRPGALLPRRCKKFSQLLQGAVCATGVPHHTPACRHFIDNPKAPAPYRPDPEEAGNG